VEAQVRAAQAGDVAALDALLSELAPWVGRLCASIALDHGPDAMQETLMIVVRNLPTLREPAALRGWVRRIAVRECQRLGSRDRDVPVAVLPEPGSGSGGDGGPAWDTGLDVRQALAALPAVHRTVLVLRDLEDLSEEETAELLGIQVGTVKSRLHRARSVFRQGWTG
jgi:RNA polymerase sigma-70 factor (ECF subfamily)